jgi:hypothetical protein
LVADVDAFLVPESDRIVGSETSFLQPNFSPEVLEESLDMSPVLLIISCVAEKEVVVYHSKAL